MKKKIIYIFGLAYISLLVMNWLVFTNRLINVDYYHLEATSPQITQFFLSYQVNYIILHLIIIFVSIAALFLLEVKKAMIFGILGFVLYVMNDISLMFVSTRALILRIFVLVFHFCILVCLIYLIFKPKEKEIENIKSIVIDMSDRFTITTIKEISEKSKSVYNIVIKTLNGLISNGEINADYFKRSKTIAFYK